MNNALIGPAPSRSIGFASNEAHGGDEGRFATRASRAGVATGVMRHQPVLGTGTGQARGSVEARGVARSPRVRQTARPAIEAGNVVPYRADRWASRKLHRRQAWSRDRAGADDRESALPSHANGWPALPSGLASRHIAPPDRPLVRDRRRGSARLFVAKLRHANACARGLREDLRPCERRDRPGGSQGSPAGHARFLPDLPRDRPCRAFRPAAPRPVVAARPRSGLGGDRPWGHLVPQPALPCMAQPRAALPLLT